MYHYNNLEHIGKGGFGNVYKCERVEDGLIFAIKFLYELNPEGKERFKREIEIQKKLSHKNIVPIVDYNCDKFYLIMPLADCSLENYLDSIENIGKDSIELFYDVIEGLKFAHLNDAIHRDVNPRNILIYTDVEENIYCALTDFGLVKSPDFSTLTSTGRFMGTVEYMAPEQRRNAKNVDNRADIYSLGKVLYKILTGETPNVEIDYSKVKDFEFIIRKACNIDREKRYNNVDELVSDIASVLMNDINIIATDPNVINDEINSILKSNDFSSSRMSKFIRILLSRVDDKEFLLNSLPEIPDKLLRVLIVENMDTFLTILKRYDNLIDKKYFDYEYCDIVANFYLKIFYLNDSYESRGLIIERLPNLAYDHNRYYVRGVFGDIISDISDVSLILKVKNILNGNCDMTIWLSEDLESRDLNLEIRNAINACHNR